MNRVRGPFNVSLPAQAAGVAALADEAHAERARSAQPRPGCPGSSASWLASACASIRASATFVLVEFPAAPGRDAAAANAHLEAEGIDPAPDGRLRPARLPADQHRPGGGEPPPGRGAGRLRRRAAARMTPFRRVAMMGIGLINGSLAAGAAARGCGRRDRGLRPPGADAGAARARAGPVRPRRGRPGRRRALVPTSSCWACRRPRSAPFAAAMRPGLPADAIVTDVSSIKAQIVRDVVPHLPTPSLFVPGHPVAGTEHSGPDAAFATLFERRRCILTPIEDTDPLAVERVRAHVGAGGLDRRRDDARAPRPGAGDHLAPAAPDRLHHRRHRGRPRGRGAHRGVQVRRRRLHRLHPHRRLRPDHVARRAARQPRGGARDARPVHRGSWWRCSAPSAGARARRCSSCSSARARSAAA